MQRASGALKPEASLKAPVDRPFQTRVGRHLATDRLTQQTADLYASPKVEAALQLQHALAQSPRVTQLTARAQRMRRPSAEAVLTRAPRPDASAPIQRQEDEKQVLADVGKQVPDGAGNLTSSSDAAKARRFAADELQNALLDRRAGPKGHLDTGEMADIPADAAVRHQFGLSQDQPANEAVNSDKVVYSPDNGKDVEAWEVRKDITSRYRQDTQEAETIRQLVEVTWRAFVLEKTGGGTCDHISAATFLALAQKGKTPTLVSYEPVSDDDYEVKAPERAPKHRSAFSEDNALDDDKKMTWEVDPWLPEGGRVRKAPEEGALRNFKKLLVWHPSYQAFVDSIRAELEHRFGALEKRKQEEGKKDEGLRMFDDADANLWDVKSK